MATDDHTLVVTFNGEQSDRAVLTLAVMPIISKVWNEANGFLDATMEVPLTSGPYRVGRVDAGQTIEYERVADWWGRDLAIAQGRNNFDRLRIDFYRERQAAFEAFKKGDIHFRQEFTSKNWATEYDFPALNEGKVVKREFDSEKRPSFQAWALNTRRDKFADIRTREAIGLAFDFEWTNRNLFYDAYARSESAFQKSDFQATGLPSPEELALLEPLRGTVPDAVFGEALTPPVSDGSGRDRALLRRANTLLTEAGWQRRGPRAGGCQRCTVHAGNPYPLPHIRAHSRPLRAQSEGARHRRIHPAGGPRAVRSPARYVRVRHGGVRPVAGGHADVRKPRPAVRFVSPAT